MSEFRRYILPLFCLLNGCANVPDFYPPPVQRKPLTGTEKVGFGQFVDMSDRDSSAYIVGGLSDAVEAGSWRWTRKRPELRFFLESVDYIHFKADFSIADVTWKVTGPVTVSVSINGHPLDTIRYAEPGDKHIDKRVPAKFLRANEVNLVAMEIDKVWVSKDDGAVLGFILRSAGFTQ